MPLRTPRRPRSTHLIQLKAPGNGANPGNTVPHPGVTHCALIHEDLAQLEWWTKLSGGRWRRDQTVLWTDIVHTRMHRRTRANGRQIMKMNASSAGLVYTLVCAKNGDESTAVSGRLLVLARVSGVTDSHMDLICCSVFIRASCQKADPHNPHCRQQLPWTDWTWCMLLN